MSRITLKLMELTKLDPAFDSSKHLEPIELFAPQVLDMLVHEETSIRDALFFGQRSTLRHIVIFMAASVSLRSTSRVRQGVLIREAGTNSLLTHLGYICLAMDILQQNKTKSTLSTD